MGLAVWQSGSFLGKSSLPAEAWSQVHGPLLCGWRKQLLRELVLQTRQDHCTRRRPSPLVPQARPPAIHCFQEGVFPSHSVCLSWAIIPGHQNPAAG